MHSLKSPILPEHVRYSIHVEYEYTCYLAYCRYHREYPRESVESARFLPAGQMACGDPPITAREIAGSP